MSLVPLIAALALAPLTTLQAGTPCVPAPSPTVLPTRARVSYGEDPAEVMDVWFSNSEKHTPVVVYIHGGAREGGSRQSIQTRGLNPLLDAGIAVAAIDHRLITPAMKAGIQPWITGEKSKKHPHLR
ncbi:MAG: hypothetical protein WCO60_18870 [Verrucomicrobiota bacterium]